MNIQDNTTQSVAEAVKKVIENKKDFKPHMMYDPKTGKEYEAKTYEDHLKMADMGYTHEKPSDKEEGNAFGQAVTDAKKSGKKKFKFQGKDYQVEGDEVNEIEIDPVTNKLVGAGTKKESVEISEDVDNFFGFKSKDKLVKFQSMAKKLKIKPAGNPTVMKRMNTEYHVMPFSGKVKDIEKAIRVAVEVEKGTIEKFEESVELQEAVDFGEIEKVMKWAKKNLSGAKLDISKKYGTAFINLTIFNIIILRLGGKKGIVVTHDDRTNGKGKDYEEHFSSANDVIKYVEKKYNEMPKDESADLEEAVKPADFVKGGDTKITKREVDGMLSKIFINTKLAKSVEASEAFKAGEKDAGKKKNPYKDDTSDFHLYVLGTQSASM